jgi:hypothetical protein
VPEESRVVSSDTVPRPSWEVRRRRYGERRWLVRHTEVYELDPITDAIWLGCVEGLTIEAIVEQVAQQARVPTARALDATVTTLRKLEHLGFVALEGTRG